MNARTPIALAGGAAAVIILAGQLTGAGQRHDAFQKPHAESRHSETAASGGTPDVIVFRISGYVTYTETGQLARAYSFGTTSCNIGSAPLQWHANDNQHPVIGQNLYRLKPDAKGRWRFDQLGQSWLKHGFCALDNNECGTCQGTGCISLGVGCSDPYTASRNGSQGPAGPKWQVNATTGAFPYPPASPPYSGAMARRLQVDYADVQPSENPDARYFAECQYVHPDDAADDDGNAANNVSYREITFNFAAFVNGFAGETVQQQPAIAAWAEVDPEVSLQHVSIPETGSFWIAGRVWDNGNGTWEYAYAVHNLDVHRAVGSLALPIDPAVTTWNATFGDVDYHSGEPFSGTDWSLARAGGALAWSTADAETDPDANALRWGTTYTFGFTANAPPKAGSLTLGYFLPEAGQPDSFEATVPVPDLATCFADVNGSGDVGFDDMTSLLAAWGSCSGCPEDLTTDGFVGFDDLLLVLGTWGDCP